MTTLTKMIDDCEVLLRPYVSEEDCHSDYLTGKNYYEWYYTYGQFFDPVAVMEIGVRYGYSAVAMGLGARNLQSIVLIDDGSGGVRLSAGADRVRLACPGVQIVTIEHSSQSLTPAMIRQMASVPFDLVHIDGWHSREGVLRDLMLAASLAADDCVLIVDDTGRHPSLPPVANTCADVRDGIQDFLVRRPDFSLYATIATHTGHTILRKRS